MKNRLMALMAAVALCVTAVAPAAARPAPAGDGASVMGGAGQQIAAAPISPTDESKVPHYFGPYPNWALSPLTTADVAVAITGDGAGATATATVGANGAVTGITITDPGSGYTAATVTINGAGAGATATATVNTSGVVTGVAVTNGGGGYTAPVVSFSGGGGLGAPVTVGNPLIDRAYATDWAAAAPVVPAAVTAVATRTWNVTAGSATGGSFTLTVDGVATAAIAWNALSTDVETALGTGVATVTGAGPWVVTFTTAPTTVTLDGAGLTQGVADSAISGAAGVYSATIGSATGGSFTLTVDGVATAGIAWNASAANVEAALGTGVATVTGTGSTADPWVITFATAPTTVTMEPAGLTQAATGAGAAPAPTDRYSATIGSATGGSFTLTVDTATTVGIAFNAAPADVATALSALAGVSATVTGTGSTADPWVITFAAAPTTVTIDGTGLTQPAPPALVPVLVVVPTPLPVGTLESFRTWNQALAGGSPTPSAGQDFHAYVLRPGAGGTYQVIVDSGKLTVPALTTPGVSEAATFPLAAPVAVAAGDVIAFYGAGIPVDTSAGADVFSYPAPTAPVLGATITLPSAEFPIYPATRTYSFAASLRDMSAVPPVAQATATAFGGVDAIGLTGAGMGYSFPTVDIDYPDDPAGTQARAHVVCAEVDCVPVAPATTVNITGVAVDDPGSGYLAPPNVVIRDGTLFDPIAHDPGTYTEATAAATLKITSIVMDTFGSGYASAPTVTITDPTGLGATATATVDAGAVTGITLTNAGSGYVTPGGIKKFTDALPGLCKPPACPASGKYIPLGVPEARTYNGVEADEYVIGVVQYRTSFSSSLPPTLVRGYVQLETPANAGISQHFPLTNELLNGTTVPVLLNGVQALAVTPPQWLGPTIAATKDKPVRIVFHNLLPTGADGDLFLPVDSTLMGSGMGPMGMPDPVDEGTVTDGVRNPTCTEYPKSDMCFKDNRATLHLHGGITPWISDGTPHQWITPAGEMTAWPQGVSVGNVPDMNVCKAADDGCQTFYYTNQQSARLMFYHDHAWGITRLNVYAGEAAGYIISDDTEKALLASGTIPADQIPLVVQDRTFVPDAAQLALQDPTWDTTRWGTKGSFWYHHVYMPAQNPGDPGGMSAYGRWMYGPWFWPPAANTVHGPIANPYYDPTCNLDDPATWTYQTDPFCEPQQIPGTPNISVGMEQFNDTPIVNGTAYPTVTLEPKSYRLRMLNAANDRFFNFQWYVGDPSTASTGLNSKGEVIGATEVALNPLELAAAQTDPVVSPSALQSAATAGPDWIQIGSEGGFLPAPTVVDGQQVTTWITDPTRFDVGNVDKHSLLLAPAERADAIVDFSKFAGKTLILYNDAPAAFPARVPSYDYYTGAPDLSPNGAPGVLPGYGPNTRTIMQVKIAASPAAPAFNLTKLQNAFKHNANGTGAFESGQHPIIVGQAAYNSAYGTGFAASSNCNAPGSTVTRCDGLVRVSDTTDFGFNTLKAPTAKMSMKLQPKAIHDEMNATTFDEFGRMQANLGVEAQPPTPGVQNVTLYPYINPQTELIDGTNLPKADVTYDAGGLPVSDLKIAPISSATDGTQIWRITHNGVDTHPIHFHLYDVQVLNRVTWDNIIIPTEASELGWKDTVRISPLEDTIVALRPIIPELPWELPNAIRPLSPMAPLGSTMGFNNVDPQGNPTALIANALVNFGWEYVYHCHILSHEEMDMMRPVSLVMPPVKADGLAWSVTGSGNNTMLTLTWNDNSIAETSYAVQRQAGAGAWVTLGSVASPLNQPNTSGGSRTYTDASFRWNATVYSYRVVAENTVGYGGAFPSMTANSFSAPVAVIAAPTNLAATLQAGPPRVSLAFTDNSTAETGFAIERATNGGAFAQIATAPARANTGGVTFVDTTVSLGTTYRYRVAALNGLKASPYSNTVTISVSAPAAPTGVAGTAARQGGNERVTVTWTDASNNESGFTIQWSTSSTFATVSGSGTVGANVQTFTTGNIAQQMWWFRVVANNALGSTPSTPVSVAAAP
jgi:FtsP/CotA-like multicopper oxidase with cupredoxin domain